MRYEAQCMNCEAGFDYIASLKRYMDVPACPLCGGAAKKVITSAPLGHVKGKFDPFRSQLDGSLITTQRDLEEHNRRNNVVLLNDGYTDEELKNLKPKRAEVDKKELAEELNAAIHAVSNGYRPTVQVHDDE